MPPPRPTSFWVRSAWSIRRPCASRHAQTSPLAPVTRTPTGGRSSEHPHGGVPKRAHRNTCVSDPLKHRCFRGCFRGVFQRGVSEGRFRGAFQRGVSDGRFRPLGGSPERFCVMYPGGNFLEIPPPEGPIGQGTSTARFLVRNQCRRWPRRPCGQLGVFIFSDDVGTT